MYTVSIRAYHVVILLCIIQECPRPEFEHEIKRRIRKLEFKGKDSGKYKQYNLVYEVSLIHIPYMGNIWRGRILANLWRFAKFLPSKCLSVLPSK